MATERERENAHAFDKLRQKHDPAYSAAQSFDFYKMVASQGATVAQRTNLAQVRLTISITIIKLVVKIYMK